MKIINKQCGYYMYLLNFKARALFSGKNRGKLPIPLCGRSGGAPPTAQGCCYRRDEIVLRLLYNFLLLLILNLKTLLIWLQFFVTHQESRQFRDTCASGIDNLISITIFAITSPNTYQGQFVLETFFFYLFSCCYLLAFNLFF